MKRILVAIVVLLCSAAPAFGAYPDLVVSSGTYATMTIGADWSRYTTINNPSMGDPYIQNVKSALPGAPGYIGSDTTNVSGARKHCGFHVIDGDPYIAVAKKRSTCEDIADALPKKPKKPKKGGGWQKKEWTCNPRSNDIKCRADGAVILFREVDDEDLDLAKKVSGDGLIDCGWFYSYQTQVNPFAATAAACQQPEAIAEVVRVTYASSQQTGLGVSPTRVGFFTPPAGCATIYSGYGADGGYVVRCGAGSGCIVVLNGPSGGMTMTRGVDMRGHYRRMLEPSPC